MTVKHFNLCLLFLFSSVVVFGQGRDKKEKSARDEKKDARREKVAELMRQAEEGVLIYSKHNIFGIQLRTTGIGAFYELGKMKTNTTTNLYRIDISEIKHPKEDKSNNFTTGGFLGNSYIYGKVNNFYQVALSFGQQRIIGQKGNKNGVAVSWVYNGGLIAGLLKPYYIEVRDPVDGNKLIKYTPKDSALFLSNNIIGAGGIGKGWKEVKVKPGVFARTALRFDYGRFNEMVSGLEVGLSAEFYASKIPIMALQKDRQLFIQAHVAILFGRRK
jgi:hypothetical protein